jgi:outer membrane protein OmpA-like peptidoglycan-associated protein
MSSTSWSARFTSPKQRLVRLKADLHSNHKRERCLEHKLEDSRAAVRHYEQTLKDCKGTADQIKRYIKDQTCEKHKRSKRKLERGSDDSESEQEDTRKEQRKADRKRWKEEREAEKVASSSSDSIGFDSDTSSDYSSFEKSHP